MKTMKKLVAALLVLTMVLALTGTALAACKWQKYQPVIFTKNAVAYKTKGGSSTSTIVAKGSTAWVACDQKDSKWVKLYLNMGDDSVTRWFKTDDLKAWKGLDIKDEDGNVVDTIFPICVVYCNGGNKLSTVALDENGNPYIKDDKGAYQITAECKKHVKATAKVWIHKNPSLSKSYGKALRKDDKVDYRRKYGVDNRGIVFFGIKYEGKCLWVSSAYSKVVK